MDSWLDVLMGTIMTIVVFVRSKWEEFGRKKMRKALECVKKKSMIEIGLGAISQRNIFFNRDSDQKFYLPIKSFSPAQFQ